MAAGLAADYIEFLSDKFMSDLEEAKEEFGVELPLLLHFEEIEKVLQEKSISPSTPIVMRNWLYTLKFALADCIMLAEKERERKAQNKKSRLDSLSLKKLWFFCRTGRKLVKIKRKLQSMKDVDVAEDEASLALPLTGSITVCSVMKGRGKFAFQINGFDEQLKKIKSILLEEPNFSDHIKTVGIVGMRGVGKTSLAYLFVNSEAWKVFSPIIWVTLCEKKMDPSEIVRRLLKTLRDDDDHNDIQAVNDDDDDDLAVQLRELHDRLCGKKYLMVLDSVWHVSEWYSDLGSESSDHPICFRNLSDSLPKGCGGAVIVSGSEDVAISMVGEKNLVRLEPTFDAEALWSIFMDSVQRKTFLTSDHHQMLSRMKDEIIDRCDGLPFAAKSLAEIISLQLANKKYWSDSSVLKRFHLRFNQPYDEDITELVGRLPGVDEVVHGSDCDEITVAGTCNPAAIARELGKFWQVELTSVKNFASRSDFTKLTAAQALEGLKFITKTEGDAGWAVVEKQFNELTASTDCLLHCLLFYKCIGMKMDSLEFAGALFDALAMKENVEGDSINKAQLKDFWDQISNQSYDTRLQTFFDVVDRDANGRITEEEVKELISLCASAEKFTNIQKLAGEYAASIIEKLDQEKHGYIMMRNLEQRRLLHWSDSSVLKRFDLRFNQPCDDDTMELVGRLPGVDQVVRGSDCDEITVAGTCNPVAIARELGKFWQVELTSVKIFASRCDFTKLTAAQALKGLKFITKAEGDAGWAVVEKQFNELTASTDGLLHFLLFCKCIGMNMDSLEFAGALFDALAMKENVEGDWINKARLKAFWDQISNQSYDSRLQTFFDVVDKDVDDRITKEEVRELISLCASAEKVTNIQKLAGEYAASIIEKLDQEKHGYIMMKNLEQRRLLHWSDSSVLKRFDLRINQPCDDNTMELVGRLPGVEQVVHGSDCDEITVVGTCNPVAISRELGKFWQVELTSVKILNASTRIRKVTHKVKRLVSLSKRAKASRRDRTKLAAAQALKGLKFITKTGGGAGWTVVEKQFNELTASTHGMLPRSLFYKCIGMNRESKDFAGELFDALARRQKIVGDSINKAQLKDFWDQISDQTFDSRLQTFFSMVDKDADGKITKAEVREIIRLSATANKLTNIQEQADEYAALIMEALDPENHEYIMIEDLERLLLQAPDHSPRAGESRSLSQIMTQTLGPAQEKNPLIRWYQDFKYFLQDNWQRAWVITLWIGVMLGLFAYKFMQYRNRADAYEVTGHCVCMAKGAAETLKLNMALMLLPVCRNTITWLRNKTKLGVAIPFDDNINFHQIIAVAIAIGVGIHGIYHLACDFPRVLDLDHEKYDELMKQYFGEVQPSSYWFFVKGVEGVTGIVMVVLMAIAFALASPWLRQNKLNLPKPLKKLTSFNAFWYSHHLFVIVYTLLIVHGIKLYLTHDPYKKTTWMYLAVPITLYAGERLIRAFRSSIKPVNILKVAVYPGNVLAIHMSKPQGFKYKSGQYMFVNCAAVSPFEWHPFYITSAPGNDYLSIHIRTLGDWTRQLKNVFSQECQAPPNGKSGLLRADRFQGENNPENAYHFPRVLIDGPYGAPAQDYKKYDVVLLVGFGIKAAPLISIVQDILNNMKALEEEENALENGVAGGGYNTPPISGSNFKTRRAYFYWVTGEQGSFDWFKGVMNEVAEMDHRGVIEMHSYCTSVYEEGDARSALIAMLQSLNHAKNGIDVVSGTRVRSHFAKPNWHNVYSRIALNHTGATIGVFYCGAPAITKELRMLALDFSHKTSTKFEFHKENF